MKGLFGSLANKGSQAYEKQKAEEVKRLDMGALFNALVNKAKKVRADELAQENARMIWVKFKEEVDRVRKAKTKEMNR